MDCCRILFCHLDDDDKLISYTLFEPRGQPRPPLVTVVSTAGYPTARDAFASAQSNRTGGGEWAGQDIIMTCKVSEYIRAL